MSRLQLALEWPLAILALLVIRSHRGRALQPATPGDGEGAQLDHLFAAAHGHARRRGGVFVFETCKNAAA